MFCCNEYLQDLFDIPGGPMLIQPGDAIVSILQCVCTNTGIRFLNHSYVLFTSLVTLFRFNSLHAYCHGKEYIVLMSALL